VSMTFNNRNLNNISAGFFNWINVDPSNTFLGSSFRSFCIELDVDIITRTSFTTQPLRPRFSDATANRLREFWGENFAKIGNDAGNAAAFQIGIWEIVGEAGTTPLDLASGGTQATAGPANTIATAQSWLNGVDGQGTFEDGLIVLDSLKSQDQITVGQMVPVPPAVILGAMGLASLVGYGVRRRRAAKKSITAA